MSVTSFDVPKGTHEYMEVVNRFDEHSHTRTHDLIVQSVVRVNNSRIKRKFEAKKLKYNNKYGHVHTYRLFHGTKESNILSILTNNFDFRKHGQSGGHRFGAGVSFSAQASYASHYCDQANGKMLLCDVLVSNITNVPEIRGGSTLTAPPYLPDGSLLRYDTTAKNKDTMDVIVKWEDHVYYPVYVVRFSRQLRPSVYDLIEMDMDIYADELERAMDADEAYTEMCMFQKEEEMNKYFDAMEMDYDRHLDFYF